MSKSDPTSSLWISEKYEVAIKSLLEEFQDSLITLYQASPDEIPKLKAELDKLKVEMLVSKVEPMVRKHIEMAAKQGKKFAGVRIRKVKNA